MKFSIIGAGAMGSLFGGLLVRGGHEVLLYDINREHLKAITEKGLSLESPAGDRWTAEPETTTDAARAAQAEVMIIFVKSTATEAVARQFAPLTPPKTLVVTLQNGMGNEEILCHYFGRDRVALGVTAQGATLKGVGAVRHAGEGPTHLCHAGGDNARIAPLAEAFGSGGIQTIIEENIKDLLWSKLVINVGINALTALSGRNNGALPEENHLRSIMADLVNEAVAVASAEGAVLTYPDPLERVCEVCKKTGPNRSSMLQDFDRGVATEIDFINGAVVRMGEAHGIPTPVNRTITALIKALEGTPRKEKPC